MRNTKIKFLMVMVGTISNVISGVTFTRADEKTASPVIVDDFAPKANRFAMSYGLDYGYSSKSAIALTFVGTGNTGGSSIIIPLTVNSNKQKHLASFNLGVSTSINDRLSIRSKVRALIGREVSSHLNMQTGSNSYAKFGDLSVGATYKLGSQQASQFYSVFGDYNIIDNKDDKVSLGRSFSVGASASFVSDPIMYSVSAAYARVGGLNNTNKYHNLSGDYFVLSPSMTFAVNNTTNLNAGISAAFSASSKGSVESQEVSSMLFYGVTRQLSENKVLSVNFRNGLTGENTFGFSTNINHRF